MTVTPGDIGMHDLWLSGRGMTASRAREPELVSPPPPPPPPPPRKSQGAGLSRWAPSGEPPAA